MMSKTLVLFFATLMFFSTIAAQQVQTVRGTVFNKNTNEPLSSANIIAQSGAKTLGAVSNDKGEFAIEKVPVGRYNITVSMIGFKSYTSSSILVYSGRETVLDVVLEENIEQLDDIVITPEIDKEQPLNKLAVVSARMLSSEEANRYAGSWGDPARMVANLAGVAAANDIRNDIIIRGNSPTGVLWRLDGFDIPNPNHFGAMGASGGPIGMLNNNQLTNSDFYTGAFPAEFGNATAGVFDLRLRNGNNRKHEFLFSAGFNGFELGAEGPLSKKTGASYMINGRYSFLDLLAKMGATFGGMTAIPRYQDVCAKVNVPLKNANLSFVSLAGFSYIHEKHGYNNAPDEWIDGDLIPDLINKNRQYFSGLNYNRRLSASTGLNVKMSYQYFEQNIDYDLVRFPEMLQMPHYWCKMTEGRWAWQANLNRRISNRSVLKGGVGVDLYRTDINDNFYDTVVLHDYTGNSTLLKTFLQWQYRFNEAFSMTAGVYAQYYVLNRDFSAEPRVGFKYEVSPSASFSLGGGLFSQLQPRQVYFYEKHGVRQNKNLKMSKSWQTVFGYSQKLGKGLHLKTELYYQHLFDVPVAPDIPQQSILNLGDDYYNNWDIVFVNKGSGRNYGIDMTLEKFFDKSFYFLITASLYDSKYRGYDKIERNTRFASNYSLNILFGYEWKIGKSNLLSTNIKLAHIGGKRDLPMRIDYGENGNEYNYVFDYTNAYARHLPAYFRADFNFNMKHNYRRLSVEWFFEIENLTNNKNIWNKYFNVNRGKEEFVYQYGFMPMGGVRMYF